MKELFLLCHLLNQNKCLSIKPSFLNHRSAGIQKFLWVRESSYRFHALLKHIFTNSSCAWIAFFLCELLGVEPRASGIFHVYCSIELCPKTYFYFFLTLRQGLIELPRALRQGLIKWPRLSLDSLCSPERLDLPASASQVVGITVPNRHM